MAYILLILGVIFIISAIIILFKKEIEVRYWQVKYGKWVTTPPGMPASKKLRGWQKNFVAAALILIGINSLVYFFSNLN